MSSVQVPRSVELRRHRPVDARAVERLDHAQHAAVARSRRVHRRAQRVLGVDRLDRVRQLLALAHVAGPHRHARAQFLQFALQLRGAGRVDAAAAEQQQVADAVLDYEVPRHQRPKAARAAGDEDGGVVVEESWVAGRCTHEAGGRHPALTHRELRLVQTREARQDCTRGLVVVEVHEHEAPRVLGLG